jgi:hypothetical protein
VLVSRAIGVSWLSWGRRGGACGAVRRMRHGQALVTPPFSQPGSFAGFVGYPSEYCESAMVWRRSTGVAQTCTKRVFQDRHTGLTPTDCS